MQNFFTVTLPLLATVTTTTASLPSVFPPPPVSGPPKPPFAIVQEEPTSKTAIREVAPEKPKETRLICKGGSRTSWSNCGGGYGLIQWTSANRYYGLGDFAKRFGGSPSALHTQLRYLTNEVQWKEIESRMKTPGKSINRYMDYAYSWIGWGHHGARTSYAYDYASRLIKVEV
jgi:hypothetical protein